MIPIALFKKFLSLQFIASVEVSNIARCSSKTIELGDKLSPGCQSKSYFALPQRWMACSNIMDLRPILSCVKLRGSFQKQLILEHTHKTKMARHAKPQPLLTAYAWQILSMQTAVLCYTQPLNKG